MKAYRDELLEIRPSFLLFLAAYYYFDPIHSFWPFLSAILAHEAGHLFMLVLFRVPVHRLRLSVGGAVIETVKTTYQQEVLIALAGPAMNLLLLATTSRYLPIFALVNLCLLLYNLLPFYPLDGGRMLRGILRLQFSGKAAKVAEQCITLLGFLTLITAAGYLTFFWNAGWWPVILSISLCFRLAEASFSENHEILRLSG